MARKKNIDRGELCKTFIEQWAIDTFLTGKDKRDTIPNEIEGMEDIESALYGIAIIDEELRILQKFDRATQWSIIDKMIKNCCSYQDIVRNFIGNVDDEYNIYKEFLLNVLSEWLEEFEKYIANIYREELIRGKYTVDSFIYDKLKKRHNVLVENDNVMRYINMAIKHKYIEEETSVDGTFNWIGSMQLLAFFCQEVSRRCGLDRIRGNNMETITSWTKFERLFGLTSSLRANKGTGTRVKTEFKPEGYEKIVKILDLVDKEIKRKNT